uniref:VHS domain-containing protein n=2 Tax=Guillardia theta TaxID=55529 RepID=A0A7S4L135_GUITH|mmetsp:Transcript_35419/g.110752  ORF Transcript_35419/g.110752 Transcript_35419/m.110752 type:complete len:485 (+) Transcript_35419:122-1576(+)
MWLFGAPRANEHGTSTDPYTCISSAVLRACTPGVGRDVIEVALLEMEPYMEEQKYIAECLKHMKCRIKDFEPMVQKSGLEFLNFCMSKFGRTFRVEVHRKVLSRVLKFAQPKFKYPKTICDLSKKLIVDWAEKYGAEATEFASAARALGWVGATGGVVPPAMNPSIASGYIEQSPTVPPTQQFDASQLADASPFYVSAMKAAQGNPSVSPEAVQHLGAAAQRPVQKMTFDQASEILGLMASVLDDHSADHALDDTVDIIAQRCAAAIEWIQAEILGDDAKAEDYMNQLIDLNDKLRREVKRYYSRKKHAAKSSSKHHTSPSNSHSKAEENNTSAEGNLIDLLINPVPGPETLLSASAPPMPDESPSAARDVNGAVNPPVVNPVTSDLPTSAGFPLPHSKARQEPSLTEVFDRINVNAQLAEELVHKDSTLDAQGRRERLNWIKNVVKESKSKIKEQKVCGLACRAQLTEADRTLTSSQSPTRRS